MGELRVWERAAVAPIKDGIWGGVPSGELGAVPGVLKQGHLVLFLQLVQGPGKPE